MTRCCGRPPVLDEHPLLGLTVVVHDLVKKRVPLKVRLVRTIASKHVGRAVTRYWASRSMKDQAEGDAPQTASAAFCVHHADLRSAVRVQQR